MQTSLIKIRKDGAGPIPAEVSLSFKPLLNYLKERLKTERTVKAEYYRFIIDQFEKEGWASEIKNDDLTKYKQLYEMIFLVLTPLASDEDELLWGLSTPIPETLFASTNGLHKFLTDINTSETLMKSMQDYKQKQQLELRYMYGLILDRFYSISPIAKSDFVYTYCDPSSKLTKYYKAEMDARFVDVTVKGGLPNLVDEDIANCFHDVPDHEALETFLPQLLPLNNFRFEGFTILTLKDVTVQHSLDKIRNVLVDHSYENEQYSQTSEALKTLAGNEFLEFRPLPLMMVNGRSVFPDDADDRVQSVLMNPTYRSFISEEAFNALVNDFKANPRVIIFNSIADSDTDALLPQVLKKTGLASYALLPVNYHNELVGVIEIHSKEHEVIFDEKLFTKIQTAIPLIAQLLKYSTDEFEAKIETVIRDKFTPLQSSVQWKFNEVAWNYLRKKYSNLNGPEIETVRFENVYPLYGAVDIRNSTTERNKAIHEDIKTQLSLLTGTLSELKKLSSEHAIDALVFECKKWSDQIHNYFTTQDEMTLNSFLESDVSTYLNDVREKFPVTKKAVDNYFDSITDIDGPAFKNRTALETSLQLINNRLNQYYENAQRELQVLFPFYFEKFRTDGIEYDIYIGQSLTNGKLFDLSNLKSIRKWQMKSMAEVARLTHKLIPGMSHPLQTTQLIFTHSNAIDISFRNDERRFDVEGAYNIRYQIVKKRIDKVLIKGTQERLTQPGKIALVYFSQREAAEYVDYIKELQQTGLLADDLEYLELEELQGVNKLKALRVGVVYE